MLHSPAEFNLLQQQRGENEKWHSWAVATVALALGTLWKSVWREKHKPSRSPGSHILPKIVSCCRVYGRPSAGYIHPFDHLVEVCSPDQRQPRGRQSAAWSPSGHQSHRHQLSKAKPRDVYPARVSTCSPFIHLPASSEDALSKNDFQWWTSFVTKSFTKSRQRMGMAGAKWISSNKSIYIQGELSHLGP